MPTIIKHYHGDDALRKSFNRLAESTFGLNFESWYQNGFWGENYTPYSMLQDGEIVANVSVNRTDMVIGDQTRRLYQLGTVMTREDVRNRGYIRAIMQEIDKDIGDADGVYLFANDSVLDFYPKFGFSRGTEHVFSRGVQQSGPCRMTRIPMDSAERWNRLRTAMDASAPQSACCMAGNPDLIFFYVSQFMQDCVYLDERTGTWAIAEIDDGTLTLHNVFSPQPISLDVVISAFGSGITQVVLGFTPLDTDGFACEALCEEDCTFFVKGRAFGDFGAKKLRIPSLSHA